MKAVEVKDIVIGKGKPKICVPVIGKDIKEIRANAKAAGKSVADIVEWRCDYFKDIFNYDKAVKALNTVVDNINGKPLILTFRTANEGGEKYITPEEYMELYKTLINTGIVDIVDIEVLLGDEIVENMVAYGKEHNVKIILSNHNFKRTPKTSFIKNILTKMQLMGADIAKMAVMPNSEEDALMFMWTIRSFKDNYIDIPVIAMSMSKMGVITRMASEAFSSAVTFASVNKVSAPGQIDVKVMEEIINIIHKEMSTQIKDINISLIGFMGSGKTTISTKLSERLKINMIDTDKYIVEKEKKSINEIFEKYGETYFRLKEMAVVEEITNNSGNIISCGGGVVLKNANVEYLKRKGAIILLRATPQTIYERVRNSEDRPILNGNMNVEFIEGLMNERKDIYESVADIIIDTDNKSVDSIVDEILEKIVEKYSILL